MQNLSIAALFLEGLFSFLSPCVLPLLPLYLAYITKDIKDLTRFKTFIRTILFSFGICTTFFILGLSISAFKSFILTNSLWLTLFSGIILIFLSLIYFNFISLNIPFKQYQFKPTKKGYVGAYLLGFSFSFSWTPCIGPLFASALVQAISSDILTGWIYIASYSLGFIVSFIIIAVASDFALRLFKKINHFATILKKFGALIIFIFGAYMIFTSVKDINAKLQIQQSQTSKDSSNINELYLKDIDVVLKDIYGNDVKLDTYKGKPLILNFFGTWCTYCIKELPYLQKINDENKDVKIILISHAGFSNEGDIESVKKWLSDNNYTIEVLFDTTASLHSYFQISGFPSSFFFTKDAKLLGYVPGYVDETTLDKIILELISQ